MENKEGDFTIPKIEVKETDKYELGLFASRDIQTGEMVIDFSNGKVYAADKASDLEKDIADHAVQSGEHEWISPEGMGKYINHSCDPNCGIKGKLQLVAMRPIKKGEELTYDYEMTEDSDWRMQCQCGSPNCRKVIGAFRNMPENMRKKYEGYISQWLIEKYK